MTTIIMVIYIAEQAEMPHWLYRAPAVFDLVAGRIDTDDLRSAGTASKVGEDRRVPINRRKSLLQILLHGLALLP
jgi:hypothetical protein